MERISGTFAFSPATTELSDSHGDVRGSRALKAALNAAVDESLHKIAPTAELGRRQACLLEARALDALLRRIEEGSGELEENATCRQPPLRGGSRGVSQTEAPQVSGNAGTLAKIVTCPNGHDLEPRASKSWDNCSECGYRPAKWCGGPQQLPYSCCSCCDFALCGDCSDLAEAGAIATPEQTSLATLRQLAEEACKDPLACLASSDSLLPGQASEEDSRLHAFVVGPVIRQIVSQGDLFVCGAAATAGALNACTEHLPQGKRLQLSWQDLLFKHFQDKLKLKVRDDDGNPVSWKVGKTHIRRVIESFPGMKTRDLIVKDQAAPQNRAAAWKCLVAALRKPYTDIIR
ncbi:unnamed protein product [Polarella glacialis]|uniref:Uncharacterized protein n=1 Tax=Polarella glacialis TaxID=89957 RepID=A0A813G9D1_POLGL|nr:unnamed protein product [Polarella glacialis]